MGASSADAGARAQRIADTVVAGEEGRVDSDGHRSEASTRVLQEAGLRGLAMPEQHGGMGLGLRALVAVCVVQTANGRVTLTGGKGVQDGARLQRLLHDARASRVMAPTTDLLLTWGGRALLGRSLLGG